MITTEGHVAEKGYVLGVSSEEKGGKKNTFEETCFTQEANSLFMLLLYFEFSFKVFSFFVQTPFQAFIHKTLQF